MKKQTWIAILIVSIVVILGIGIGVKAHMDRVEINQERQIAVQVKQMFKDIREIEIKDVHYNSSTGYTHANVNVCQNDGATFFVNITLGEPKTFVGGTEAMRQQGKTEQEIEVFYKNRESERIK